MSSPILDAACVLLDTTGLPWQRLRHPPAIDAAALAEARGLPITAGVKALVLKVRGDYVLLAVRAHERTDNRAVRRALAAQKLRFARPEELTALGLVRGQIPPIGRPLMPFDLIADPGVLEGEVVAFTAGSAVDSIVMATADWRAVAAPRVAPLVARPHQQDPPK